MGAGCGASAPGDGPDGKLLSNTVAPDDGDAAVVTTPRSVDTAKDEEKKETGKQAKKRKDQKDPPDTEGEDDNAPLRLNPKLDLRHIKTKTSTGTTPRSRINSIPPSFGFFQEGRKGLKEAEHESPPDEDCRRPRAGSAIMEEPIVVKKARKKEKPKFRQTIPPSFCLFAEGREGLKDARYYHRLPVFGENTTDQDERAAVQIQAMVRGRQARQSGEHSEAGRAEVMELLQRAATGAAELNPIFVNLVLKANVPLASLVGKDANAKEIRAAMQALQKGSETKSAPIQFEVFQDTWLRALSKALRVPKEACALLKSSLWTTTQPGEDLASIVASIASSINDGTWLADLTSVPVCMVTQVTTVGPWLTAHMVSDRLQLLWVDTSSPLYSSKPTCYVESTMPPRSIFGPTPDDVRMGRAQLTCCAFGLSPEVIPMTDRGSTHSTKSLSCLHLSNVVDTLGRMHTLDSDIGVEHRVATKVQARWRAAMDRHWLKTYGCCKPRPTAPPEDESRATRPKDAPNTRGKHADESSAPPKKPAPSTPPQEAEPTKQQKRAPTPEVVSRAASASASASASESAANDRKNTSASKEPNAQLERDTREQEEARMQAQLEQERKKEQLEQARLKKEQLEQARLKLEREKEELEREQEKLAAERKQLEHVFYTFDKDRSGLLDRKEIKAIIGDNCTEFMVDTVLRDMAGNVGVERQTITLDDFVSYALRTPGVADALMEKANERSGN